MKYRRNIKHYTISLFLYIFIYLYSWIFKQCEIPFLHVISPNSFFKQITFDTGLDLSTPTVQKKRLLFWFFHMLKTTEVIKTRCVCQIHKYAEWLKKRIHLQVKNLLALKISRHWRSKIRIHSIECLVASVLYENTYSYGNVTLTDEDIQIWAW